MKKILIFVALLFSCTVQASSVPDFPFILVNGTAYIDLKPDRSKITFELIEFSKNPELAVSALSKNAHEIISFATKNGISKDHIISSAIEKSIKRAKDSNFNDLQILGYEISQSFTIELENIEIYTEIIDKLANSPNLQRLNSDFDISNKEEVASKLVRLACENAKKKATDLAAGLDVKLGAPFAVTQDADFTSLTAAFGATELTRLQPPALQAPPPVDSNMFVPKSITIQRSVNVVYKLIE